MRLRWRHAVRIVALTCALAAVPAGNAWADTAGTVHFVRSADSGFDVFTGNSSAEGQAWLRSHMWRMMVWSPYFDQKTSWYGQGWMYDDAYAIYRGSQMASQHPEWILKDAAGNNLYIPFGCSGGSCPQFAGDISNAAFRHNWIAEASAHVARGYRGLFVDDVNLEQRTGNGEGQQVTPIDPSTGQPMSAASWRGYMAEFMAEIRAALPHAEIVHNALWFANGDAGTSDPSIRREIESADYILLERGVNDSGLTGGSGRWSLNAFLSYIDQIHSVGRGIVLDGGASDPAGMEYNLASYFLTSTGNDAVSGGGQTPNNWWTGWNVNLGEASGPRRAWGNVLRRDFTAGMVLVNPPGAAAQTVSLPAPMQDMNGKTVTSVTLAAASGVVLRGNVPAPAIAGEPARAIPTQTIVGTSSATPTPAPVRAPTADPGSRSSRSLVRPRHRRRRHAKHHARSHKRAHQASRAGARPQRRGKVAISVRGTVRRATRGTVAIQVDERRAARWVAVAHLTVAVGTSGRFGRLLDLASAGRYRVRAAYLGTAGYQPSLSRYRFVARAR
jgi:Hypothetical glycosyl hydrolase family 15